jgi:hypothetical protein
LTFLYPAVVGIEETFADHAGLGFCQSVCRMDSCCPVQASGATMPVGQPRAADNPFEEPDDIDEAALTAVLRTVPLGAAVLAGSAVALLVLGYVIIYLLIFLPRGVVG